MQSSEIAQVAAREGMAVTVEGLRRVLARLREQISEGTIRDGSALKIALEGIPQALHQELRRTLDYSLRPVINATGVLLHTNLGRAPLSQAAVERIAVVVGGYCNLEFDLESGERGRRDTHLQRLFSRLLRMPESSPHIEGTIRGEKDGDLAPRERVETVVVNNCAAAVMLALNSLAEGGEVIVSRGELVEIGESFRIPEIMAKAGVILREVGTTNRTRISDYRRAINEKTKLLLRVHRSNFAIVGFTEQPSLQELAELGATHHLPVMEDLGGGALLDPASLGLPGESGVIDSLRAGADVVTYSGDKLLGGPQAGLISGKAETLSRIRGNSMFRALRVDKLTSAALEATLLAYLRGDHDSIPVLRMMRLSQAEIDQRAQELLRRLEEDAAARTEIHFEIIDGESVVGGGAAPTATLPTRLLAINTTNRANGAQVSSADNISARLRSPPPGLLPVVTRVFDGRVVLDLRTVFPEQDASLATTIAAAVAAITGAPEP